MADRTPSQRLFTLAGWIVAVPIVLGALYVAFFVSVGIGAVLGVLIGVGKGAGVVVGLLGGVTIIGWTIKKVWKG